MKKFFSFLFVTCCFSIFFSCQKDFSIENGITQVAEGSLWDSAGNCLPSTVTGTFYNGVTPGGDTAYVEIQVNVTQTGSYNITTAPLENGLEFIDSGFFSTTGINTIRLKPIGTPILNTPTTFNISFDGSFCSFTVNIQDSTGTGLGGQQDTVGTGGGGDPDSLANYSWQFNQDTLPYNGTIDTISKDTTGLTTALHFGGTTSTGDTTFSLNFVMPTSDIQPGTYTMLNNGIFFSLTDKTSLTVIYEADGLTAGTDFTIVITSYDSVTKLVEGTFSGNVKDQSGNIVPITNGLFKTLAP
jgi:hypothetical protein